MLAKALVHTGKVASKDFKFADVKAQERSSQKLLEQTEEIKADRTEKEIKGSESSLYKLKDLLRGSIITDSVEETEDIVEALLNLDNAKVYEFKNGYNPKEGETANRLKYADIKIILLIGSGDNFEFEELVEIQVIQRINLELKKLEHKL